MEGENSTFSKKAIIAYVLIDVACVGLGMGVPIFCILFGFFVGWYIAKKHFSPGKKFDEGYRKTLKIALLSVFFTFLQMVVVWWEGVTMLFNPKSDFKNFGHPFLLYDPLVSFVGWLVLMIVLSPLLQLLMTIFASFVFLAKHDNTAAINNVNGGAP
jgi:hypothetical protein